MVFIIWLHQLDEMRLCSLPNSTDWIFLRYMCQWITFQAHHYQLLSINEAEIVLGSFTDIVLNIVVEVMVT